MFFSSHQWPETVNRNKKKKGKEKIDDRFLGNENTYTEIKLSTLKLYTL